MLSRRPSERTRRILELLYEYDGLPSGVIADHLGIHSRAVSAYLNYLKRKGIVEYVDGMWRLTRQGRDFVEKLLAKDREYIRRRRELEKEIDELIEMLEEYLSRRKSND